MNDARQRVHLRRATARALEPTFRAVDGNGAYGIKVEPPAGTKLAQHSLRLDAQSELVLRGVLTPTAITYLTPRWKVGVYSRPQRRAIYGAIPPHSTVRGGLPSSSGWVALDDDESWVLDDGSLTALTEAEPHRFAKKIPLPSDAAPALATVQPRGAGLLVLVPRRQPPSPSDVGAGRTAHTARTARAGKPSSTAAMASDAAAALPSVPPTPPPTRSASLATADGTGESEEKEESKEEEEEAMAPTGGAGSTASASAGAAMDVSPPPVARRYSPASAATCTALAACAAELSAMEGEGEDIGRVLASVAAAGGSEGESTDGDDQGSQGGSAVGVPAGLRTQLALLWSRLNKLLEAKLDALTIGALGPRGQAELRAVRKGLIGRTQAAIERVEAMVAELDALAEGGKGEAGKEAMGEELVPVVPDEFMMV